VGTALTPADRQTDGNDDGKRRHHHDTAPAKKSRTRDQDNSNAKRRFSLMATKAILKSRVHFAYRGPICNIMKDEILPELFNLPGEKYGVAQKESMSLKWCI
jgi:hypothetical protein